MREPQETQETWVRSLGQEDSLDTIEYLNFLYTTGASPVAQTVKNLPAMHETWVRSLGREDHQEKEMATHSGGLMRIA